MTALFPPYHTPLSASNGANLLCAAVLGGYAHYNISERKNLHCL